MDEHGIFYSGRLPFTALNQSGTVQTHGIQKSGKVNIFCQGFTLMVNKDREFYFMVNYFTLQSMRG
jgi:hypothetical protein